MYLNQETVDRMDQGDWEHYNAGGCVCAAWSDVECICGSWWDKDEDDQTKMQNL